MKRILVVDDEPRIIHFLKRGLTLKGFEVIVAANGTEAIEKTRSFSPDLVVLDIVLPDMDGFAVCERLRELANKTLPILMLSAKDEVDDKVTGLDSGADDYITKPFDFEELVARIRAGLRRGENNPQQPKSIVVGELALETATRTARRGNDVIELTRREYDLLEFLALNAGQVLLKERIFEHVWGYDNDAGLEVIKVYINYVRTKLNAGGKADMIHSVRGIGYMLKP